MTAPAAPPPEEDPQGLTSEELAAIALAVILVAAAAAAAAVAAAGAAGIAGTAARTVGALVARPGRRPLRVAPAGVPPRDEALQVLLRLGADPRAAAAILARFLDHPLPPRDPGRGAGIAAGQASDAALWRARYLVTATRRLADAVKRAEDAARAAGDDPAAAAREAARTALEREERHFAQHLDAQADRQAGGQALDAAVEQHGMWLTWRSRRDERVTRECDIADGHLFRVDAPPWIGLPGTGPHRGCRCYATGPLDNRSGLTVNEALAAAGITRHDH